MKANKAHLICFFLFFTVVMPTFLLQGCAAATNTASSITPAQSQTIVSTPAPTIDEAALNGVLTELQSTDHLTHERALMVLGNFKGDERAINAMIEGLKSNERDYRIAAAYGLGMNGDKRGVDALIAALKDSDFTVRTQSAGSLGEIGDERAVEPLIDAYYDMMNEGGDSRKMISALGKIGGKRAVEAITAILQDKSVFHDVRSTAAEALGTTGDMGCLDLLTGTLQDENEDPYVRISAAGGLGNFKDKKAVDALILALNNKDAHLSFQKLGYGAADALNSDMRFAAANSLGKIGDQSAVDALKAALQESDRKVVIAVAGALVTIGGDEAILSLNTAFDANNLQAVAGAYTYFISQGKAGTEQTLITSLNQYGDQYMAIAFLNCGNTQLMEAANAWAKQHNYQMITYSGSSSEAVRWGG